MLLSILVIPLVYRLTWNKVSISDSLQWLPIGVILDLAYQSTSSFLQHQHSAAYSSRLLTNLTRSTIIRASFSPKRPYPAAGALVDHTAAFIGPKPRFLSSSSLVGMRCRTGRRRPFYLELASCVPEQNRRCTSIRFFSPLDE